MKFTIEHYQVLKTRVASVGISELSNARERYVQAGHSDTRFIMDVFYATKTRIGDGIGLQSNCGIVGDYDDKHIQTATKKALTELGII